jgi:hypothetical protein
MPTVVPKIERDFSQPVEADFIVALKAKSGGFDLFVEAFARKNGKEYLRHTSDIREARRFARFTAEDVVEQVKEYRCLGRVERVSPETGEREVVVKKTN